MADRIFLNHHSHPTPSKKLLDQFHEETRSHWFIGPTQKALDRIFDILGFEGKGIQLKATLGECHEHVLFSHYTHSIRESGRTHILALENEPKSILNAIRRLEVFDVQGKILPTNDQGQLTGKSLKESLRARSSLLSISWAHLKTGVIQPIHELIGICKENDVLVHLDLSGAIGKLYFKLSDFDADYITFDGTLLGIPFPCGVILSKQSIGGQAELPFACFSNVASALAMAFDEIESHAMETAFLRDNLELKLDEIGGVTFSFKHVDRLPNIATASFEGIHAEQIADALRQEAIEVDVVDPFSVSFTLSLKNKQEEIDRLVSVVAPIAEKLRIKPKIISEEDAKAKSMRLCKTTVGDKNEGRELTLTLLIDEDDGVIADALYTAFAPPSLHQVAEIACLLLLRKNYMQARRITSDLIEKKLSRPAEDADFNLVIDAIDAATENCMDIPIEDIYAAPPEMEGGERSEYPGWEALSNDQKKAILTEVIERDVRPYVELDAGGVDIVKVEDNRVTIAYSGNCTSCFSATGATLEAIGGILRHKIFPDLMVIPDTSLLQY